MMTAPATLTHLWRWPVKGFGGETLDHVDVEIGQLFPHDRAFAIEDGPSGFDPDDPKHVSKQKFICMVRQPSTAKLTARYDDAQGHLSITTIDGRAISIDPAAPRPLESLTSELVDGTRDRPLRLCRPAEAGTGHGFTDVPDRWISMQNQASIEQLESACGAPLDPRRFRANLLIDGWEAFAEEDLVGQTVEIGTAAFRIEVPINRCRAIDVDPETTVQDHNLVRTLRGMRGKPSLGIYATVTRAGRMTIGDRVSVR